ncbi:hypothetical protein E1B28_008666 [Marasmius oreades]|uniref:Uncharacterized protein n=1 Tax=Marasmius oreades TaxID=181124 RepID=A0A9P7RYS9_9AGAR|nr:uncharacterized protein E1B28_008666 [Marasmius oreades]KAG7092304.1 hypothetical protein E1B28_008666 [Marasmius oreades]
MSSNTDGQQFVEQARTGSSDVIGQEDMNEGHETSGQISSNIITPSLPEIQPSSDLGLDLSDMFGSKNLDLEKVQKRASNVQKLAQENDKLKAELKAMSERLEAAERRREELSQKKQMIREPPTN